MKYRNAGRIITYKGGKPTMGRGVGSLLLMGASKEKRQEFHLSGRENG